MFLMECRKTVKSITYVIYVVILVLFAYTQMGTSFELIEPPQKGLDSYGVKHAEQQEVIIPNAVDSLYGEYMANSFTAYPVGFYKVVKLSDQEQGEMAIILSELTIVAPEKREDVSLSDVPIEPKLTYERFHELMKQADSLIGGGSKYSDMYLTQFGDVPMTYEDAMEDYNEVVGEDKITGALARLFSDYMGIVLSIFPVFIAVALGLKDRRAKMQDLMYTRQVSSFRLMFTRYCAMVAVMFMPVLLLALYATVSTAYQYSGLDIDLFAFIKYSLGWLLPSLMVSTAVGVCLTVLTDTPIAIAVQGLWWFIGLNMGMQHMEGGYGMDLVVRHNKIGNTGIYLDNFNTLVINRFSYTLLAVALIMVSVGIYELKRRGNLDVLGRIKKIFSHR